MHALSPQRQDLLCRRCGYALDAAKLSAECPECGADTAGSLPEARDGTPIQAYEGGAFARFFGTWRALWKLIRGPGTIFEHCPLDPRVAGGVLRVNLVWAAALLTYPAIPVVLQAAVFVKSTVWPNAGPSGIPGQPWFRQSAPLAIFVGLWIMLRTMVAIERAGVRFIGKRKGLRVTPTIASSVTAFASPAWAGGALAVLVLGIAASYLHELPLRRNVGAVRWPLMLIHLWLPVLGFFGAMVWFESMVWVGIRRCRFANEPRTEAPPGA